jgi:predicted secreted hydrolase
VGRDAAQHARRFGYQLTVFRHALASLPPARASNWATRDLFMGHLSISDLDGAPGAAPRFHAFQRFARDGLGLAGARSRPFEVWVDTWRITGANGPETPPATEIFPVGLRASEPPLPGSGSGGARAVGFGVDLSVAAGRGPILQGERGWSVKGAGDGNASFYYSCTRLPTRGRVTLGSETFEVTGTSWLDREWSTSALDPDVAGWGWLGVHLDDGRDLVLYRLRSRGGGGVSDGHAAPASLATLIDAAGETHRFGADAFSLSPSGSWTSADGAARYPAAFLLKIPAARLDVVIRPILSDQELLLAVRYWEGAVSVSGTSRGHDLTGSGYLELTGYSASGR